MKTKIGLLINTVVHYRKSQLFFLFYHKFKKWRLKKYLPKINTTTLKLNPNNTFTNLIYHPCKINKEGKQVILNHKIPLKQWRSKNDELINFHIQYMDAIHSLPRESALELIDHWIKHNPILAGSAWHPYTVSRRLINWMILFSNLEVKELSQDVSNSINQQLVLLEKIPEKHLLGNHLIANASALIIAGIGLNQHHYIQSGCKILRAELKQQFYGDGCHYERSIMYHISVLQDLWNCYRCLSSLGPSDKNSHITQILVQLKHQLQLGGHFLSEITFKNSYPHFGDSAAGMVLEPKQMLERINSLFPITINKNSEQLSHFQSGYLMYKSPTKYVVFNCGPLGPDYLVGHGHADLLSFEYWDQGSKIITDSGTYSYQGNLRPFFRSIKAHSTISVNNSNLHELWSNFKVGKRTKPYMCKIEEEHNSLIGSHKGHSNARYTISRKIICTPKQGDLAIQDTISGRKHIPFESYLQIHHQFSDYTVNDSTITFESPEKKLKITLNKETQFRIDKGMESETFYTKKERNILVLFGETTSSKHQINITMQIS